MATGYQPHPNAAELICPRINGVTGVPSASVTNSRFAMLVESDAQSTTVIYVWDWRMGKILLVSECLPSAAPFDSTEVFIIG